MPKPMATVGGLNGFYRKSERGTFTIYGLYIRYFIRSEFFRYKNILDRLNNWFLTLAFNVKSEYY